MLFAEGYFELKFFPESKDVYNRDLAGRAVFLTAVESSAYYESYQHVLTGLQNFKPDDIPFQNHIVRYALSNHIELYAINYL